VPDTVEADRGAVEDDLAVVAAGGVDAGEHLHQRRLACAVLAADRVDLAPADRQAHVLQRLDAGEGLGDGAHLQDEVVHGLRCPRKLCAGWVLWVGYQAPVVSMAPPMTRSERTGSRWCRPDPAAREAAAGSGRSRGRVSRTDPWRP